VQRKLHLSVTEIRTDLISRPHESRSGSTFPSLAEALRRYAVEKTPYATSERRITRCRRLIGSKGGGKSGDGDGGGMGGGGEAEGGSSAS
jgi:hypothetical protein